MTFTRSGATRRLFAAFLALLTLSVAVVATPASAQEVDAPDEVEATSLAYKCVNRDFTRAQRFLKCLNVNKATVHEEALRAIGEANGNSRAAGTPGYDLSVDYVAGLLEDAGLSPVRQEFALVSYEEVSSSLTVDGESFETQTVAFSRSGEVVDGNVIGVDLDLGPGNASTSGCEATDFDGLDFSGPNDIALLQRGACAFADKAANAAAAGAEGAIIFNQCNTDDRCEIIGATLGGDVAGIPVLDLAYADALIVLEAESVTMAAETIIDEITTENLIVDIPGVNPDNVVMAGAHLDSVAAGPGIQDNGSGSAAILAVALEMANNTKYTPQNTLRFAWWGAEELGLVGSFEYFLNADFGIFGTPEADKIAAYLNFDMIASPNYYFGVYDADESTFVAGAPVPPGSQAIEDIFEAYYSERDIAYDDSAFSGRSDYQVFLQAGIPAGGLFTGAEGRKTAEQEEIWGGRAGRQFDPCYHEICDTYMDKGALKINLKAVAYAVFHLAATTESVNGVTGVEVAGRTPADVRLDGAQGTFAGGGGGLDPDHDHDHSLGEPE